MYVLVNFPVSVFIFPLFLGMVMYANGYKTKEKQKLTGTYIKNLGLVSICPWTYPQNARFLANGGLKCEISSRFTGRDGRTY